MVKKALRSILSKKYIPYHVIIAILFVFGLPYLAQHLLLQQSPPYANREEGVYPIAEVIREVRKELYDAQVAWNKEGEAAMFEVEYFDLELAFILRRSSSIDTKAEFELLAIGSDTKVDMERVQRIKLHMKTLSSDTISLESTTLPKLEDSDPLTIHSEVSRRATQKDKGGQE